MVVCSREGKGLKRVKAGIEQSFLDSRTVPLKFRAFDCAKLESLYVLRSFDRYQHVPKVVETRSPRTLISKVSYLRHESSIRKLTYTVL